MDTQRHTSTVTAQTSSTFVRATAWAGIAGPVLFTASFLAQEQFRRGEYSPVAEVVSALEAGPNGWIQQVSFVVLGVLTIAQAAGLHRALAPTRAGVLGPAVLALTGVGALVAAAFPLREDAAGVTYDPGGHMVGGMVFFLGTPVAFLLLGRRLAADPGWRALAPWMTRAGVALVASAIAMNVLVIPDEAPLQDWAGLVQRAVVLGLIFPPRVALGIRLLELVPTRTPA
jgi:hypothetical membrane protein